MDFSKIISHLSVSRRQLSIYLLLYFSWGLMMHHFGAWAEIARFTFWWQVISCYLLYMVPISLLLRPYQWHTQYAYGLVAMGALEFMGYWLGTSIAFEGNLLDQLFGERNFALGMALFFGAYFPLGNIAVKHIDKWLDNRIPTTAENRKENRNENSSAHFS